ncbi:MAG: sugar phosphate nucleotidyltransferase [Lachnospiraceae bacterium]
MDRTALLCRFIKENPKASQRELARNMELSLGTVNTLIKESIAAHLLAPGKSVAGTYEVTDIGDQYLEQYRMDGALILAAGFGSRFVPLTFETPKGLLEVFGERMIERQIKQLHAAGVTDITIAVGYLKEKFEYLIDKYQVKLLYNPEYASKNTLTTLYHARDILMDRNMYVLASDHWMKDNMFHTFECGSWYSASYMEGTTSEWVLCFNKKGRITEVAVGGENAWVMYGPACFSKSLSRQFLSILNEYYHTPGTEQYYWEQVFMDHLDLLEMDINRQPQEQVYEFENLEQLRAFDPKYQTRSDNKALKLIAEVFHISESDIHDIRCLKAGMTNQSFLFEVNGSHYICRIPGPGTELLINRKEEAAVYQVIAQLNLSEHIIYMNEQTGYKIAEYYEGARNSRPDNWDDIAECMNIARQLHHSGLQVDHEFNIRERIDFYEKLCAGHGGTLFEDYDQVKDQMNELMDQLDHSGRPKVLSHIDSVADNFLFLPDGTIRLIDWEYAGMCDPFIDVAMGAIYSYYNEEDTDRLIDLYLEHPASGEERRIIYSYVALGGFLWSLWAIYKSALGDEFGEYTLIMYRYAKQYYRKVIKQNF